MSALPGLAALAVAYVLSQFFRTALAVVAPELAADLGLDPARLGVLSSAWFWAFAAAQLPIGVALDRWGPRRTVGSVFLLAGLGCAVFRPRKVEFPCPRCALLEHDVDAVYCKACGHQLKIPNEG